MRIKLRTFILGIILLGVFSLHAQILEPAKWSYTIQENSSQEIELTFKVKLDDTWYVYATDQNPDLGPICSMETVQCVFGEQEFDINLNQSK
ncbi:hypothetical protein Q4Q39_08935 [Flavivirga amylovorans]|uniref:Thiol:disulfide interchange protein DsbD N-terminal domain-containing protein n=1 Tax=Flavivirga amylovorans TaxID=870486 RepID=A0ABT8X1N9_9FLAO|nr:hypothetical protein [Flavivirga amylovorans]MDO5987519.1 hypothetical protein [Flavivirga amylovorans]